MAKVKTVVRKEEGTSAGVKIMHCDCKHDFQDKTYGTGMRVHNKCKPEVGYRCTVCERTKGKV